MGNTHSHLENSSTISLWCWDWLSIHAAATVLINVRHTSTTFPTADLASQNRTAARPKRNTSKKDTGVNKGETNPSSLFDRSFPVCDGFWDVSAITHITSHTNKHVNGMTIMDMFLPPILITILNDLGRYFVGGIICVSHANNVFNLGGYNNISSIIHKSFPLLVVESMLYSSSTTSIFSSTFPLNMLGI